MSVENAIDGYEPECPICKGVMVLRIRKQDGHPFYGCLKYPACNGTMTVTRARRNGTRQLVNEEERLKFREAFHNKLARQDRPNYYEYLRSPAWKRKVAAMQQSSRYRCQVCNKGSAEAVLNVHHRSYERLGHELPSDLVVLCRACHAKFHDKLSEVPYV